MQAVRPVSPAIDSARSVGNSADGAVPIRVRDLRLARDAAPPRWWVGGDPIATAWFNALSATFPRGEAMFIDAVKAHRDGASPTLAEQVRAFVVQEVNHSREHLVFNRMAVDAGYDLSRIDAGVSGLLDRLYARPPIFRLAATIALEHFTAMMAHEFLSRPEHFAGADGQVADLWRWHAIEEIEHKGVAYDTWRHATRDWRRWRRWRLKATMMLIVTRNFIANRVRDALDLLAQDGITGGNARLRLWRYLLWSPGVLRRIAPAWLAYFRPGFHPWQVDDRHLIAEGDAQLISSSRA